MPAQITLEALNTDGAPQAGITVTGLPAECVVTVDRRTDTQDWELVRGAPGVTIQGGSLFLIDHVCPLNKEAAYRVRITGGETLTATITVPSDRGWLSDPLDPKTAIPLLSWWEPGGIVLTAKPQAVLSVPVDTVIPLGARYAVASVGTRGAPSNIPIAMVMDDATATRLKNVISNAGQIVLRGHNNPVLDDVANLIIPDLTHASNARNNAILSGTAMQVRPIAATFTVVWFSYDDLRDFLTTNLGIGATWDTLAATIVPGSTWLDIAKNKNLLIGIADS